MRRCQVSRTRPVATCDAPATIVWIHDDGVGKKAKLRPCSLCSATTVLMMTSWGWSGPFTEAEALAYGVHRS
jgi:hypothetical protein